MKMDKKLSASGEPPDPHKLKPLRGSAPSLSGARHEDVDGGDASTSRRHDAGLSTARRLAVARPKLSGRRSSSTVLSQVCLGLPVLRRQSLGGPQRSPGELGSGLDRCRHGTDDRRTELDTGHFLVVGLIIIIIIIKRQIYTTMNCQTCKCQLNT